MSTFPPVVPGFRRVVLDVPDGQVDLVIAAAKQVGAVVRHDGGPPMPALSKTEALRLTIANAKPVERSFLEMLVNAAPETAVTRATIAKALSVATDRLHTVAMAPFCRRMNARLAVPENTLIDQFIERARTPNGDWSYRLRAEYREIVITALRAGDSEFSRQAA